MSDSQEYRYSCEVLLDELLAELEVKLRAHLIKTNQRLINCGSDESLIDSTFYRRGEVRAIMGRKAIKVFRELWDNGGCNEVYPACEYCFNFNWPSANEERYSLAGWVWNTLISLDNSRLQHVPLPYLVEGDIERLMFSPFDD